MPPGDKGSLHASDATIANERATSGAVQSNNTLTALFAIPAPLKALFDRFPLRIYPSNPLPFRPWSTCSRSHTLYVFADPSLPSGAPSVNPSCLRYQTLLRLAGVSFKTEHSNNHASPTGSLPFLAPAGGAIPVPAAGLPNWLVEKGLDGGIDLARNQLHSALLEPIRRAYLLALYLHDGTSRQTCDRLYVDTASHSIMVRAALVPGLRGAALEEVIKTSNEAPPTDLLQWGEKLGMVESSLDTQLILGEAEDALSALNSLLGERLWFGGGITYEGADYHARPGWMDACVFAYTQVITSLFHDDCGTEKTQAPPKRLYDAVTRHRTLMDHRGRVLSIFQD